MTLNWPRSASEPSSWPRSVSMPRRCEHGFACGVVGAAEPTSTRPWIPVLNAEPAKPPRIEDAFDQDPMACPFTACSSARLRATYGSEGDRPPPTCLLATILTRLSLGRLGTASSSCADGTLTAPHCIRTALSRFNTARPLQGLVAAGFCTPFRRAVSYARGVGVIRPYAAPGAGYVDFNAVAWCVTTLQGWREWPASDGRGRRLKEFARAAEGSAAAHAGA